MRARPSEARPWKLLQLWHWNDWLVDGIDYLRRAYVDIVSDWVVRNQSKDHVHVA